MEQASQLHRQNCKYRTVHHFSRLHHMFHTKAAGVHAEMYSLYMKPTANV
jgi:hypothetical protein